MNTDISNARHWERVANEFRGGADHVNQVRQMTLKVIDAIDAAMPEALAVAPRIRNSRRRPVDGLICYDCRTLKVAFIDLELTDSLVAVDETFVFVRCADGVKNLYAALASAAARVFTEMADTVA